MGFRITLIWVALLLAPLAHAQDAFVVPNANATVEGDAANLIPFSIAGGNTRYQQVYLSDDIPAGPLTIYGIAFRPDAAQAAFEYTLPSVDVYLGITTATTTPDAVFANNVGAVHTLVASGPLPISSAATGPVDGPKDFDIEIWFDQPFEYASGNLLLDVSVQPSGLLTGQAFDAVNNGTDPVGRVYSAGLAGGSVTATSGTVDTQGLVTKFMLVPEPDGAALAAFAALVVSVAVRKRGSREAAR
jgi:hypothetical protein